MAFLWSQNPILVLGRKVWSLNTIQPRDRFLSLRETLQLRKLSEIFRTCKSWFHSKIVQTLTAIPHHVYTTHMEGSYRTPKMHNRSTMTSRPGG